MKEEKLRKWQPQLLERFEQVLRENRLGHAYLFSGQTASFDLAIWLSQAQFCQEPLGKNPCGCCRNCRLIEQEEFTDVTIVRPSGNIIKTETVRELVKQFSTSGFESSKQVFIICDAEKMHANAANSLLKVIEEPQSEIVVFLLTNQEEAVLPTIKSRAQVVYFPANKHILQTELELSGLLKTEARLLSQVSTDQEEALQLMKSKSFKELLLLLPKFVQVWSRSSKEAYLMVSQLVSLVADKGEQERLLDLLTVLVSSDWKDAQLVTGLEDLLLVRRMWKSNVSLQNALEYVLLR